MILIVSRNSDTSTDLVISWLIKWAIPFLRVNEEFYEDVYIDYSNNLISIKGINIIEIKVVWFRKFPEILNEIDKDEISKKLHKTLIYFKIKEAISIRDFLLQNLRDRVGLKWLTNPFNATENKLIQMKTALKCGLLIPESYVLTSKLQLEKLVQSGCEYITKPIDNCIHLMFKNKSIRMKTTVINSYLKDIPDNFPPALIQKKINRKYEVRIFYLMGKFFATKIIDDNKEEVDHRINLIYLNGRFENFSLPIDIKIKLNNLLNEFDLNCASIDMIIDENDNFYFLEINPTGQFTYHSVFNNTYLEKEIASALKKLYENNHAK